MGIGRIQAGPSHRIVLRWLVGSADFAVILCPRLIGEVGEAIADLNAGRMGSIPATGTA